MMSEYLIWTKHTHTYNDLQPIFSKIQKNETIKMIGGTICWFNHFAPIEPIKNDWSVQWNNIWMVCNTFRHSCPIPSWRPPHFSIYTSQLHTFCRRDDVNLPVIKNLLIFICFFLFFISISLSLSRPLALAFFPCPVHLKK